MTKINDIAVFILTFVFAMLIWITLAVFTYVCLSVGGALCPNALGIIEEATPLFIMYLGTYTVLFYLSKLFADMKRLTIDTKYRVLLKLVLAFILIYLLYSIAFSALNYSSPIQSLAYAAMGLGTIYICNIIASYVIFRKLVL